MIHVVQCILNVAVSLLKIMCQPSLCLKRVHRRFLQRFQSSENPMLREGIKNFKNSTLKKIESIRKNLKKILKIKNSEKKFFETFQNSKRIFYNDDILIVIQ